MNRDEFEKLPEIAKRLHAEIYWNYYQGKYQTDSQYLLATVGYLNGAWYAYQEQQKKIDAALEHINKKCDEFCETHDMDNVALLEEVEDLLK